METDNFKIYIRPSLDVGYLTQNLTLLVVEDRMDNVEDGGVAPALVNLHVTS